MNKDVNTLPREETTEPFVAHVVISLNGRHYKVPTAAFQKAADDINLRHEPFCSVIKTIGASKNETSN